MVWLPLGPKKHVPRRAKLQKNIYELGAKVCQKIKNQPTYLGFFLLDALVTIIFFPKYLYYLIRKEKIVAFDWGDGTYSDFYLPLFEKLDKSDLDIVFFFRFGHTNRLGMTIFKKGLPRIYGDFLDNKVVICASPSKYEKLPKTTRIQIFHGFGSFGSAKQKDYIERFDVLFLGTKFQWHQLRGQYKKIAKSKRIFCIGYPKIDKYISAKETDKSIDPDNITLFYGPTYHREISSIFEFLPAIVQMCQRNNYKLIIKLHPFLFHRHNYDESGGIDWPRRIYKYKKAYDNITFLREDKNNLGKYFGATDIFLTDVSGLGIEFVLTTSKPIVFLGNKLKVPLEDLRKGDVEKYKNYPEVYYRTKIGPIVAKPSGLEETVKKTIKQNDYKTEIEKFRKEWVFNLGTSADAAASKIKKIHYGQ
jgi:hypothetical protein